MYLEYTLIRCIYFFWFGSRSIFFYLLLWLWVRHTYSVKRQRNLVISVIIETRKKWSNYDFHTQSSIQALWSIAANDDDKCRTVGAVNFCVCGKDFPARYNIPHNHHHRFNVYMPAHMLRSLAMLTCWTLIIGRNQCFNISSTAINCRFCLFCISWSHVINGDT